MEPGKDPSEAVKLARKGVELEPTAPHYHILAMVCQHAGNVAAARQAMARAVQLDPRNPQYRHVLRALREQGQP
jgi:Flp pilus assembly protein TadD